MSKKNFWMNAMAFCAGANFITFVHYGQVINLLILMGCCYVWGDWYRYRKEEN